MVLWSLHNRFILVRGHLESLNLEFLFALLLLSFAQLWALVAFTNIVFGLLMLAATMVFRMLAEHFIFLTSLFRLVVVLVWYIMQLMVFHRVLETRLDREILIKASELWLLVRSLGAHPLRLLEHVHILWIVLTHVHAIELLAHLRREPEGLLRHQTQGLSVAIVHTDLVSGLHDVVVLSHASLGLVWTALRGFEITIVIVFLH